MNAKRLSSKNATKLNSGKIAHINAVTVCKKNNETAHVSVDEMMDIESLSVKKKWVHQHGTM